MESKCQEETLYMCMDDINPHILSMLEDAFSLEAAQSIAYLHVITYMTNIFLIITYIVSSFLQTVVLKEKNHIYREITPKVR